MIQGLKRHLLKLVDSLDLLIYTLLFLLGFGALGYLAYAAFTG